MIKRKMDRADIWSVENEIELLGLIQFATEEIDTILNDPTIHDSVNNISIRNMKWLESKYPKIYAQMIEDAKNNSTTHNSSVFHDSQDTIDTSVLKLFKEKIKVLQQELETKKKEYSNDKDEIKSLEAEVQRLQDELAKAKSSGQQSVLSGVSMEKNNNSSNTSSSNKSDETSSSLVNTNDCDDDCESSSNDKVIKERLSQSAVYPSSSSNEYSSSSEPLSKSITIQGTPAEVINDKTDENKETWYVQNPIIKEIIRFYPEFVLGSEGEKNLAVIESLANEAVIARELGIQNIIANPTITENMEKEEYTPKIVSIDPSHLTNSSNPDNECLLSQRDQALAFKEDISRLPVEQRKTEWSKLKDSEPEISNKEEIPVVQAVVEQRIVDTSVFQTAGIAAGEDDKSLFNSVWTSVVYGATKQGNYKGGSSYKARVGGGILGADIILTIIL